MISQVVGQLLPIAAAVALSPIPVVAVILVLDSTRGRVNGPAFAAGWLVGLTAVSVIVVALAGGASHPDSAAATGVQWGKAALGVLLLVMAARQWKKRPRPGEEAAMPSWMASLSELSPWRAVVLGLAVSAANPKNLMLTAAAAATIAQAGLSTADEAITIAVFVALGSVTVVGAVLAHQLGGRRAEAPLAAMRRFMAANNAAIMMVVLLLLGLKVLGDALGGL